jgi:hypothetical protein
MIVVADPPSADVGRMVAVANMMERYQDNDPCYLQHADFSQMDFGETLFISAHGSGVQVGRRTATDFADELLSRGLKSGTRIDLRSCSSGIFVEAYGQSFTEQLAHEIKERSKGRVVVFVEGYTGTGVIQEHGAYRAKDSTLNVGELKQEYQSIIDEAQKGEWPAAKKYINTALVQGTELSKIAVNVKEMTKDSFSKLYAHNLKVLKSINSGKTSSSLSEYLREMDPQWATSEDMLMRIRAEESSRWANTTASYIA